MDAEKVAELKRGFRGNVLLPDEEKYVQATRGMFNQAFVDRKPVVIVQPLGAADVSKAVKFAAENHLIAVPRGGGHGGSGLASTDGGMLIDMALMKSIFYDPESTNVTVEAGCRLSDIDYELMPHNRAVPIGLVGLTGIGGLAMHGGMGLLTRKHGMCVDNILQVEIVISSGEILVANEKQNQDLFWAVRGAGSNVGVITRFVFKTHAMPKTVYGGFVVQPAVNLVEYHDKWAARLKSDPNFETTSFFFAPPTGPPCGLIGHLGCHFGEPEEAEKVMEDSITGAPKAMFGFAHQPFNAANQSATELFKSVPPTRQYWKSMHFKTWNHEHSVAFDNLCADVRASKFGPFSLLLTEYWDPSILSSTRDLPVNMHEAVFVIALVICWMDPALDQEGKAYAEEIVSRFDSLGNIRDKTYFNYSPEDNVEYAVGNKNMEKLLAIKQKYDPNNMFAHGTLKKRK